MKSRLAMIGRSDLPSTWSRNDWWSGRGLFTPLTRFGAGPQRCWHNVDRCDDGADMCRCDGEELF